MIIIEYDVTCFERNLVIKCPDEYTEHKQHILELLDKYYFEWHNPEDVEDDDDRDWLMADACCEEYMMIKLSETYPACNEESWDSYYYGDDEDDIEDDRECHPDEFRNNIEVLQEAVKMIEGLISQCTPYEKLGVDVTDILTECVNRLHGLGEFIEEEE